MSQKVNFASLRKTTTVDIPEMGGIVYLRQLTISEFKNVEGAADDMARLLSYVIIDESGQRIYTTEGDIANLGEMPASIAQRLLTASNKLNGFGQTDQIAKNS